MTLLARSTLIAAAPLMLASCWKSSTKPDLPQPTSVSVELAAVTLGDDCGEGWTPPPPILTAQAPRKAPATPAVVAAAEPPADEAEGAPRHRWSCEQTSMQLSLTAGPGTEPTPIAIKRVELLDASGHALSTLTVTPGRRWANDHYQAWDQSIEPGARVAATYVLSSPEWYTMEGGQWAQRGKTFQLRVTVAIGDREQTVDKQAITPVMMEPAVPT